jgi:hypothetical protein
VGDYLEDKGMSDEDIQSVTSKLDEYLGTINIPTDILQSNPTVDPKRQNLLYNRVKANPDRFIIKPKGNDRGEDLYDQLERITNELNNIFKFARSDSVNMPRDNEEINSTLGQVIYTANLWLGGASYNEIINRRIDSNKLDTEEVDKGIKEVMEIVNEDIGFVLVKYYKILIAVLAEIQDEPNEWMQEFDRMLEMGSYNFGNLHLMSKGVDRSVVIGLDIPPDAEDSVEYVRKNIQEYDEFHKRHLRDMNIL